MFHTFAGDHYYPTAGIGDYVGGYPTLEQAIKAGWNQSNSYSPDWVIVLTEGEDGHLHEAYNENVGSPGTG